MSKSKKSSKINVFLENGEACVVLDKGTWQWITSVLGILSEDVHNPSEKEEWDKVIQKIDFWVTETFFEDPSVDQEDWNDWED